MNAYSLDLRERVIQTLCEGVTQSEVAEQFGVSLSTVEKWWRRWRETGSIAPRPSASGPARVLAACERLLRRVVKQQPAMTLSEVCAQIETKTGLHTSPSMMCRELQTLHLPRKKKSLHDSQRDTPRVQRQRRAFKKKHARLTFPGHPPEIYR